MEENKHADVEMIDSSQVHNNFAPPYSEQNVAVQEMNMENFMN